MQAKDQSIVLTGQPETPLLPGYSEPDIAYSGSELILSVAILIRSVALLIQVIGQQKERKSNTKAGSR